MNNDELIIESLTILRSTLESYKENPTWSKLQAMFQQTLLLGIELGKKQVYMSQQTKGARK